MYIYIHIYTYQHVHIYLNLARTEEKTSNSVYHLYIYTYIHQARAENQVSNSAYWITQRWGNRPNIEVTKSMRLSGITAVNGTTHIACRTK